VWGRVGRRRSRVGLGEMQVEGKRREAEGRRLLPAMRGGSGVPPPWVDEGRVVRDDTGG
jgi:hypothetical protein